MQLEPVLGRGRLLQDRAWRGRVRNRERRRRECQQRQMERAWCAGHVISELQHAKLWPLPAVRMQRRDVSTFTLFRMLIFRTFLFFVSRTMCSLYLILRKRQVPL